MATNAVRTTKIRVTQDVELEEAVGPRKIIGDTASGDITITLHEFSASAGPITVVKPSADNTLSIELNGATANGDAGPIELNEAGSAVRLIPGTEEWIVMESIIVEA